MRSISSLCCYRFPAFGHRHSNVKRTGDATRDQTQSRIDHSEGLGHIETERSHPSVHTGSVGEARGSGSDSGMGSGRDRPGDGNRSLALPRKHITRQKRKHRRARSPGRPGHEDDDLSIISDPNTFYLAPLISVSSNGTEIRVTPAPERIVGDTKRRSGSTSTAVPSPTKEQSQERPADTEGIVPLGPEVRQVSPKITQVTPKNNPVERTTPSKLDSVLVEDDPWSPFQTWLLTQTLDTDTSPSRRENAKATPKSDTIVTRDVHDKLRPRKGNPSDLRRVQISTDSIYSEHHQVSRERHPSKGTAASPKSHSKVADQMAHLPGAGHSRHSKGSSYSPGQRSKLGTKSPGRRNNHGASSSRKSLYMYAVTSD